VQVIRHIVLFSFHNEVSEERRAAFDAAARRLAALIPAIARSSAGPALALQAGPIDYVLELDFGDAVRFREYKEHAAHQAFIEQHVRPCVAQTTRAQVTID